MILDASAAMAIFKRESEAVEFAQLIEADPHTQISAVSVVELAHAAGRSRTREIDAFLHDGQIDVVPFTALHAGVARLAFLEYGRGSRHPAKLNFGDCMTYALAKVTGEPLLFKGDDFSHTDVESARG
jgi:ribonuclease VapC